MIRRSLSWAWLGLAAAAVLLALLVTLLRFGSPWLASWQQQWLDRLLSEHQLTLEVGQLGLSWQDYGPVLVVSDVSLHRPEAPAITLRRALVDVQLWQSLRQWQPILNEITLDGLRLPLNPSGAAAGGPRTDMAWLSSLVLEGVKRFSLNDAQLVVTLPQQELFELHLPALHWQNSPGLHQGEGSLGFGPAPDQQLVLKSRFTGPIDRLDGSIYLQADQVDASAILSRVRARDRGVNADFNFELWLEWQQGTFSAGLLNLGENRLRWGDDHQIAVDGGRVQWQPTEAGWQLASSHIDISVDAEAWPSWNFQLDRHQDRLLGYLDRLTFTDLALLAQWGEPFWPATARQLEGISPGGQLSNLYFSAAATGDDWHWQGELEEVSTHAFGWVPQTRGLNGHFSLAADRGQLSLDQQQAADWIYDGAFREPWPMQRLSTELHWRKQPDGWLLWSDALAVDTADLALQGWFSLQLPARGAPLLSASASVDVLRAERAFSYFPEPLMGAPLVNYLQGAIRGGQADGAEVLWYGRLNAFPYADGSGIFQARVPLREAEFRFNPHWQPLSELSLDLLFENDGLYMKGREGQLGAVVASAIDARIVPLRKDASLRLSADIEGKGEAVTAYLQDSPLAGSVGTTLEQVQVTGPLKARLALEIPLRGGPVAVDGQVDFERNRVRVKLLDLPLDEVSGRLLFDERQTRFEDMQAKWSGQPLRLDYRGQQTDAGYEVGLDIRGRLQAAELAKHHPPLAALGGAADWRGNLELTLAKPGEFHYRFEADSALQGLSSTLPPPLNKIGARSQPSHLEVSGDGRQARAELTLGEHIRGQAGLGFGPTGARVHRLWLSAGAGVQPTLPRPPLDIAVRVPDLPLDDWLALLREFQSYSPAPDRAATRLTWPGSYRVSVQASRARLWQQPLHQLQLSVVPAPGQRQQLSVTAEQAEGTLGWGGEQPWQAHFSRLWLAPEWPVSADSPTPEPASDSRLQPGQLPALEFRCDDCRWRKLALGKVAFDLRPLSGQNGIQLADMSLDGPLLQAKGHGQWLQHDSGNLSRLEWQSSTPSLQRLWLALDKESPFSETAATFNGQLRWLDVPWRPDRPSLNGRLAADTEAGVLSELNDRGAGLLSVLSMESVLRRLRLDFRDVFEQGFYFDRISASGELQDGVLRSDDLELKGAAGDLSGRGLVDLAAERLDYRFEFTPDLTGNLPVLAAFAVTPVTGLYVLALSKVLGPVVDVFTRIRYRVEGPLAQPRVTELGREQDRVPLPGNE
ncbi:YhdP family protein [Oceanisphaera psychrotolerans]|uniref:TIGR02099 family protein n=1 Tax=Oceanisphaera psychrotolerans TaxID=1414654 RepID=A0A1J4QEH9_9GAMM|nr:YhdP family protein [Oceanisphaera psychrotolerans]OIN10259.1 TIGR02099 family protein [Oceanisphaera psychrotolerans]